MQFGRANRSACMIDTGTPRNRFAAASHGFFGQDGAPPREMIANAREKVAAYPSVRFIDTEATEAVAPIVGLEGEAPGLAGVRLADGRLVEIVALYLAPHTSFQSPIAEQLGCALDDGPFGPLPFRYYRWQNRCLAEQPLNGCAHRLAIALG